MEIQACQESVPDAANAISRDTLHMFDVELPEAHPLILQVKSLSRNGC